MNLASVFPTWNDPSTWNIAALAPYATIFTQGFGNYIYSIPTNAIGSWFQDDWKVSPRLTLNLGFATITIWEFSIPTLRSRAAFRPLTTTTICSSSRALALPGMLPGRARPSSAAGPGCSTRISRPTRRSIDADLQRPDHHISLGDRNRCKSHQSFGAVRHGDRSAIPFGAVPVAAQTIQPLGPNVHTPYSLQLSGGVEHQITKTWSFSADFIHWRVYHDWESHRRQRFLQPDDRLPRQPQPGPPQSGVRGYPELCHARCCRIYLQRPPGGRAAPIRAEFFCLCGIHAFASEGFHHQPLLLSE